MSQSIDPLGENLILDTDKPASQSTPQLAHGLGLLQLQSLHVFVLQVFQLFCFICLISNL